MLLVYALILSFFSLYTYSLIDPNITFFQTTWWEIFRDKMIYLGYYRRDLSWVIYLTLVVLLFLFNYLFVKFYKKTHPIKLALLISVILLISYPFLSHDFFNYMFDAKILTVYHQNPYLYKALDFPSDLWLRFMHWTHRTYPYGPVFLVISVIPSFISLGKFVLGFVLFKLVFSFFYLLAVFYLNKINKKYAVAFATSPLIIVEGLVNSHNDLIAVSLGIVGVFYLLDKKRIKSFLFFLLSGGVKFITLPVIFLNRNKDKNSKVAFGLLIGTLIYLSVKSEIQPWYFLNLLIFLPFFENFLSHLNIFFFGLLVSYYPYIRMGGWDSSDKILFKHWTIVIALFLNLAYFVFWRKKIQLEKQDIQGNKNKGKKLKD